MGDTFYQQSQMLNTQSFLKVDYVQVIKSILNTSYAGYAEEWVKELTQKDKQGLRIIRAIMKHQGKKKFISRPKPEAEAALSMDFHHMSPEKIQEFKKSMRFDSTYERFFGRYHDLSNGEAEILKYKKLSDLKITTHLNPQALSYIQNWTFLKDDNYYVSLVIVVLRNLYTFLKNLQPKVSTYTEKHYWAQKHELVNPSRFDTIEKAIKKETHKNLHNANYNKLMRDYSQQYLRTSKQQSNSNIKVFISPAEIKQQLMRGNSNLLGKVITTDPATTSYMANFKGLMPKQFAKPLDLDLAQSITGGSIIPDPYLYQSMKRQQQETIRTLQKTQSLQSLQFYDRRAPSTTMSPTRTLKYW